MYVALVTLCSYKSVCALEDEKLYKGAYVAPCILILYSTDNVYQFIYTHTYVSLIKYLCVTCI